MWCNKCGKIRCECAAQEQIAALTSERDTERLASDTYKADSDKWKNEAERLRIERDGAKESKDFSDEWYAVRHERLKALLATTQYADAYFNIMANGTASVKESPTYAQIMNGLKHELVRKDERIAALGEIITKVHAHAKEHGLRGVQNLCEIVMEAPIVISEEDVPC